ncbi:MFS transporter [Corynebacterium sp. HMSC036E10]|uniref:MFS transporter n=1 Tax=Corynebacterium sp. HMSC036E10 TaxID=1715215 RepID=UPI0008A86803|nr:MFS transporter [Corynebacterium sp. HMSC036E10]OHO82455.1 MFS transporter [Corynebacterium sp. HMSC036E10]
MSIAQKQREDALFKKINKRILPLLLLCYVFAYLDRVNLGFAKLYIQDDYPYLTDAVFGLAAGIFFLAYASLEIPSNLWMNRVGARRTITRIMVLWGLASSATMFVSEAWHLYLLRVLLGIFEAGFAPGIILYLTYWYPAKRMATAMGVYMLAGPIGSILGSAGSALVIEGMDGVLGLSGWQWMFPIQGLPAAVLGIIFWFTMADSPEEATWLSEEEKRTLGETLEETAEGHASTKFSDALKLPQVHVMAAAYFGIMCGIYATSFWLPSILGDYGIEDRFQNGILTSLPYFFTIVVMIMITRSSDKQRERFWHTFIPSCVAIVGLVGAAFVKTEAFLLPYLMLLVAVCMVWAAYTVFWAVPGEIFGGTAAAGGIAYINTFGILGGFVAPTIMGYVRDATGSSAGGLMAMVVLLVVSCIALIILKRIELDPARERQTIAEVENGGVK